MTTETAPQHSLTDAQRQQTDVNFYILPDADLDSRLLFVYRLLEKAVDRQLPTLIIAADEAQLTALDRLIWTAKPARFIAHEIISESLTAPLPPVLLCDNAARVAAVDFVPQVVIDLSYDATPLPFAKIMLIANQHQDILANARMKYQAYAKNGITPTVHKL